MNPADNNEFKREWLKQMRSTLGFTQSKLAEEMRTTQVTVARWENGTHPVPEWAVRFIELIATKRKRK